MQKTTFTLLCLLSLVLFGCNPEAPLPEETESNSSTGSSQSNFIDSSDSIWDVGDATGKPVLYLYPESTTELELALTYQGVISSEYPESEKGVWHLTASPDGTLTLNERSYPYIFWEGYSPLTQTLEFKEGFSVERADYISFLEAKLTLLGLTEKEQTDFITYWLPKMQEHDWATVSFLYEEYENLASWQITPEPDQFIRIFMILKGSDEKIEIPEQILSPVERNGFTAVEWGGTHFKN